MEGGLSVRHQPTYLFKSKSAKYLTLSLLKISEISTKYTDLRQPLTPQKLPRWSNKHLWQRWEQPEVHARQRTSGAPVLHVDLHVDEEADLRVHEDHLDVDHVGIVAHPILLPQLVEPEVP